MVRKIRDTKETIDERFVLIFWLKEIYWMTERLIVEKLDAFASGGVYVDQISTLKQKWEQQQNVSSFYELATRI